MNFNRRRAAHMYSQIGEMSRRWADVSAEAGSDPQWLDLTPYEHRVFSQNGEDGVICEIFRRIGVGSQTFVEFGIDGGQEGNCVFLADVLGWSGLFMESHPGEYRRLASKYGPSSEVKTRRAQVTPQSIDALICESGLPEDLDIISIDVDGPDLWVWRGLEQYRPRVVVVEYNSAIDQNRPLTQPVEHDSEWDYSNFFGASFAALVLLGRAKRYRLVHCDLAGVNLFFVRDDMPGMFLEPEQVRRRGPNFFFSAEGHSPSDGQHRYVEYDGT